MVPRTVCNRRNGFVILDCASERLAGVVVLDDQQGVALSDSPQTERRMDDMATKEFVRQPTGHRPAWADVELGAHTTSVWNVAYDGGLGKQQKEHPTQKPTELFSLPLRIHTQPGAVCLEPFSGSGTQIIAAEQHGRVCRAVEIEPTFCDIAVRRWEEFTGEKAVRA